MTLIPDYLLPLCWLKGTMPPLARLAQLSIKGRSDPCNLCPLWGHWSPLQNHKHLELVGSLLSQGVNWSAVLKTYI